MLLYRKLKQFMFLAFVKIKLMHDFTGTRFKFENIFEVFIKCLS